jgi:pimeloyl-ACP methyl ester carboxylesterase
MTGLPRRPLVATTSPHRTHSRTLCRGLLLAMAALSACTPPPPATNKGGIVRSEAFPGAPGGATATHIIYGSTAPNGTPIQVSALVVIPSTPPPTGGRPVVAWLHPTTGIAQGCAPSQGPTPFAQIQGLTQFLAHGDVVVATDYAGLGMPGPHPYLVGASEARAALDSVRAAHNLPEAHAGTRFAVWGHSQGGQAALFAAGLAPSYAPDLQLVGAAAAAPVTDIGALLNQPADDPLWGALLAYTVASWSQVYGLKPAEIVTPDAEATITRTAAGCLETREQLNQVTVDAASLAGQPVTPNDRWRAVMNENDPQPWSTGVPVLLTQGARDPVIDPLITRGFAQRLCQAGVPVRYVVLTRGDHYTAGVRSAGTAAAWIAERFAGIPPRDDCQSAALQ